jgi:hypothetical protein
LDAGGSTAACGAMIASYAWSVTGGSGVHIVSVATSSAVSVTSTGTGTLTLVVTDSAGKTDTATINFSTSGASTSAPATAGTSAGACVTPMTVTPAAPTVTEAFEPTSVPVNAAAVLTVTFANTNGFALTQSGIVLSLPANLALLATPAPATTCTGANMSLSSGTANVTLSGANIPVDGSCTITLSVKSAAAGTYSHMIAANDLMTGPAGGNTQPATASLTVSAAASSGASTGGGGGGGGGDLDWLDIMLVAGVLLVVRGHASRRPRP